jgi:hypothetical protein
VPDLVTSVPLIVSILGGLGVAGVITLGSRRGSAREQALPDVADVAAALDAVAPCCSARHTGPARCVGVALRRSASGRSARCAQVDTTRSAKQFARGQRGGILTTSMPHPPTPSSSSAAGSAPRRSARSSSPTESHRRRSGTPTPAGGSSCAHRPPPCSPSTSSTSTAVTLRRLYVLFAVEVGNRYLHLAARAARAPAGRSGTTVGTTLRRSCLAVDDHQSPLASGIFSILEPHRLARVSQFSWRRAGPWAARTRR